MCHVLENSFMNGFNKLGDFGGSRGLYKNLGGLAEPPRSCRKKRVINGDNYALDTESIFGYV